MRYSDFFACTRGNNPSGLIGEQIQDARRVNDARFHNGMVEGLKRKRQERVGSSYTIVYYLKIFGRLLENTISQCRNAPKLSLRAIIKHIRWGATAVGKSDCRTNIWVGKLINAFDAFCSSRASYMINLNLKSEPFSLVGSMSWKRMRQRCTSDAPAFSTPSLIFSGSGLLRAGAE